MRKEFNDTGLCVPEKHYMVNTLPKLDQVMALIDRGKYFTMNRPRQFGKTTTVNLLYQRLLQNPEYLVIRISFEAVGDEMFQNQEAFVKGF
ncbi:MAG: hypothetical protein HC880_18765 [Bacteroidia bacterium]|nr:hypothetical protein [Bacteroidia bacterium]